MNVQVVLFDMDGVLVDAREWHFRALNRALALHGFTITEAEHVDRYDGLPTRVKLVRLTQEKGLPAGLYEAINRAKQVFTVEEIEQNARPNPQHARLLRELRELDLRLGLCSNARRESVDLILDRVGLRSSLDLILSADDVQRTKPDPQIYARAMMRFAVSPHACLIVEDSPFGIAAARASGGHVLEVEGPDEVDCTNVLGELYQLDHGLAREGFRISSPAVHAARRSFVTSHAGAARDSYRP